MKDGGIQRPKFEVMKRLKMYKSAAMMMTTTADEAAMFLEWAKALPTTSTKRLIAESSGYKVNSTEAFLLHMKKRQRR